MLAAAEAQARLEFGGESATTHADERALAARAAKAAEAAKRAHHGHAGTGPTFISDVHGTIVMQKTSAKL